MNITTFNRDDVADKHLNALDMMGIFWTFGFTFIIIFGTIGNSIMLWIILAHEEMWNSTNYLLANLNVVDLLMATLNAYFNFVYMRDKHWSFGSTYCSINNFMAHVTVAASVMTLVALIIERYHVILQPMQWRFSRSCLLFTIILVWCFSGALAMPALLYSRTLTHGFNIVFFVATYLVPVLLMGICCTRIGLHLYCTEMVGEVTPVLLRTQKKKKKIAKMFFTMMLIFSICWLPYHLYFIYVFHDKSILTVPYIHNVYLGFYWLAMSNCTITPVVYFWLSMRFRSYFLQVMFLIPRLLFGQSFGRQWQNSVCEVKDNQVLPTQCPNMNNAKGLVVATRQQELQQQEDG